MAMPLIAGNWKMHTTVTDAVALAQSLRNGLNAIEGVTKVLCPPFISLVAVSEVIKGSSLKLGAQNMHFEKSGAYTGEISPLMLSKLCQFVILGHSERRHYFGESDEMINKKVEAALEIGLKPILCVGERLEENEAGMTLEVITKQIKQGLKLVSSPQGLVIAYEPIWAIGTGKAATAKQANHTITAIRKLVAILYGEEVAQGIPLLYGGSVSSANITEFVSQPEIDGALVGGASLRAGDFVSIVEQTARIRKSP